MLHQQVHLTESECEQPIDGGLWEWNYYKNSPNFANLKSSHLWVTIPQQCNFRFQMNENMMTSSPSHMDQSRSWVQSHNHLWFQRDLRHQTPPGWCRGLACKHERQRIQLHAVETNTHIGNNPVTSVTGTMVVSHQGKPTHYALF